MGKQRNQRLQNQPFYWFALLENATRVGNAPIASKAQRQLKRLGFDVRLEQVAGR